MKWIKKHLLVLGCSIWGGLFCFCLLGTIFLPMDPYQQNDHVKNLAPSMSYLDVPKDLEPSSIVSIHNGITFGCALQTDGTLSCWGEYDWKAFDETMNVKQMATTHFGILTLDEKNQFTLWENEKKTSWRAKTDVKSIQGRKETFLIVYEDGTIDCYPSRWKEEVEEYQGKIEQAVLGDHHMLLQLKDTSFRMLGNQESSIAQLPKQIQKKKQYAKKMSISTKQGAILYEDGEVVLWGEEEETIEGSYEQFHQSQDVLYLCDEEKKWKAIGTGNYQEENIPKDRRYDKLYGDTYQIYGVGKEGIDAWGLKGFLFGSDEYGRDILQRFVHGGMLSMSVGFIALCVEMLLGIGVGLWSGYCTGKIDWIWMRICDVLSCIPILPFLMFLSTFLIVEESGMRIIMISMIVIGILSFPNLARLIRSIVRSEKEKEYIESAKLMGASTTRILRKHLLPQLKPFIWMYMTSCYVDAMLLESGLSFLGFGVKQPNPTWGNMLQEAQSYEVLQYYWWQWFFPFFGIFLSLLALQFIQVGLRKKRTRYISSSN